MINEVISYILTIGWIVGITNAINLIDGLDGLSSGITLISCISLLVVFALNESPLIAIILITALAGAIVGFLPYNFNPAKTFIGDVGSNFLGFSIAVISIIGVAKTYTAIVLIAPIMVLALPIFDTLWAIIRRIAKTKSLKGVFKADKGHLHHRIVASGFSQKQAVLILYGISAAFGIFAIILLESEIASERSCVTISTVLFSSLIISQYISAVWIVFHLMRLNNECRLHLNKLRIHTNILLRILKIGVPAGIQGVIFSVSNITIQSSINGFGSDAVAGSAAASNVEGFVYIAMNSMYQSVITFVGQNVGANRFDRVKKMIITGCVQVTMIGLIMECLVFRKSRKGFQTWLRSFLTSQGYRAEDST